MTFLFPVIHKIILAERTTLEPVNHELGSHYGLQQNLTELGTDITPTSMSQLRKLLNIEI